MPRVLSRRKFIGKSEQALMATGAALGGGAFSEVRGESALSTQDVDYYAKLGVTPFTNAAGH